MHTIVLTILASSWAYTLVNFFRRLGAPGLFLLAALDSSFLFLPFGNDFLLIAMVSASRGLVWIPYVVVSALGSLLGVFVIDLIMRKAGEEGLERFVKPERVKRMKKKLDKGVGWVLFTSTLLPPPFPFTPVVMCACALQCSRTKLYAGVFAGRLLRFTIEALLALYFGRHVLALLNSPVVDYFVYAFVVIAVVGTALSALKWFRSNKRKSKKASKRKSPGKRSEA